MNNPIKAFCLTALASTGILAITSALFCCSGYFNWQCDWRIKTYCDLAAYIGLAVAYVLALRHQVTKSAAIIGAVGWGMIALDCISCIFSSWIAGFGCRWVSLILFGIGSAGFVFVAISFALMPRNLHAGAKVTGLIGAWYKALLGIAWLVFHIAAAQGCGSFSEEVYKFYGILVQFSNIPDAVASILLVVPFAVMMIARTQLGGMLNAWRVEAGRVFCTSCGNEVEILPGQMSAVCMKCGVLVSRNMASAANGSTDKTDWFSFGGRARRREYWAKTVSVVGLSLLLSIPLLFLIFMGTVAKQTAYSSSYSSLLTDMAGEVLMCAVLGVILGIVVFLLLLPVNVRRLHDRNMSGWFLLLFWLLSAVPFVGWIVSVVQFVIIGCLEGTVGPNQFGADPKEKEHTALLRGLNAAQASNDTVSHGAQPDSGTQSETSVRLKKLQELRAQGLISAAEYEEKRSEVLETL